tara:strand:+ start:580 stop:780 length:201 start_codon:yes stop_codon:yes gene_type:complete
MTGDMVVVLFGCSIPVILRKISTEGKRFYNLIGEYHAHGYMDGEAIIEMPEQPMHPYPTNEGFVIV